jgi:hypothetical protein
MHPALVIPVQPLHEGDGPTNCGLQHCFQQATSLNYAADQHWHLIPMLRTRNDGAPGINRDNLDILTCGNLRLCPEGDLLTSNDKFSHRHGPVLDGIKLGGQFAQS